MQRDVLYRRGATLALKYGARNAIIGMALSVVCYGIVNGIISRYAIRTGLSVALFSRKLFGTSGAALATLIFFATAIYYAVFEGAVIAVAAHPLSRRAVLAGGAGGGDYSVLLIFGSVQRWLTSSTACCCPSICWACAGRGNGHARIRL